MGIIHGVRPFHEIQAILRQQMNELRERYAVKSLHIFGSYARADQTPTSDVDILVEFETKPGLLKFLNLESYLSDLLGVEVQLTTIEALRPEIREQALREAVSI
ncbi:MAG: nucleotidyltransferase family protein [Fimbriimonadales bacterium]